MPIQLICLANSWKESGRCIAGIRRSSGEWLRPVPADGGPIEPRRMIIGGREIRPLDLIELELRAPRGTTRFQKENCEIVNWNWRLVGRMTIDDIRPYCETSRAILHSIGRTVEPAAFYSSPWRKWTSLQLVHATHVRFERDDRPGKDKRWVTHFQPKGFDVDYQMSLTDPVATTRLNQGEKLASECLLTISLTKPIAFPQYDVPPECYKVAATVIEL